MAELMRIGGAEVKWEMKKTQQQTQPPKSSNNPNSPIYNS